MDFLNHRKGDMVFYQVFLLSPLQCTTIMNSRNCKRMRDEEIEISRQVTLNSKEEISEDFCLDFVQELSLWPG